MINCRDFLAEFGDYLDGLLEEEARQELDAHLSQCLTCQVVYNSTRKTLTLVTDSGAFELPAAGADSFVTEIMAKVRETAAAEPEPDSG